MDNNILVVDDSKVMRRIIERTFNICGYESISFFEASNGKEGLSILDNHAIDLLLVDINMPIMDGTEMIEEVKKNTSTKDLPIVVISVESNKKRIEKLNQFDIIFIHKPFTPEKFMAKIEKLI